MPGDRARGPGRPPHEPTIETRELVIAMVGRGDSVAVIAETLGLSEPTVRAHYEDELAAPGPQAALALDGELTEKAPRAGNCGGRPEHLPTRSTRNRVEILVAGGQSQWQIAAVLGISVPTLVKHYSQELDDGRSRRDAQILEALFAKASAGNVSAIRTWLGRLRPGAGPADEMPAPEIRSGVLGKKEQRRDLVERAATGKYEPPAPPRHQVN
jgi:DNA-binding CsgD family transcriptional regulator